MLYQHHWYNTIYGFFIMEQQVPQHHRQEIYAVIEIDKNPLAEFPLYRVNIQQLINSAKRTGSYEILSNSFGKLYEIDPISVTHHRQHISWHVKAPVLERIFHFEKQQYKTFVAGMQADCRQLITEYHPESILDRSIRFEPYDYESWPFLQDVLLKTL